MIEWVAVGPVVGGDCSIQPPQAVAHATQERKVIHEAHVLCHGLLMRRSLLQPVVSAVQLQVSRVRTT